MGNLMPSRQELLQRVFAGVSHEELREELETDANRPKLLRRLASIPVRTPEWWERVLGWWLLVFWTAFAMVYSVGILLGPGRHNAIGLAALALSLLLTIQVWRRNGSAYGAGAVWITVSLGVEWWGYWTALDATGHLDRVISIEAIIVTACMSLAVASMLVLWQRLFPHVTVLGRHRHSPQRRVAWL